MKKNEMITSESYDIIIASLCTKSIKMEKKEKKKESSITSHGE